MSKVLSKDRLLPHAVLTVLVLAFCGLTVLQYRWTTQGSEVAELRTGTNLKTMMINWHIDLFRRLSELPIALQVGPDAGAHDDWHDYLQRYKKWVRTADDPALIQDVYIWETSTSGKPHLLRFSRQNTEVQQVPIVSELRQLLNRLKADSASLPVALRAWEAGYPEQTAPSGSQRVPSGRRHRDVVSGWQFDEGLMAVVHPIVHHPLPGAKVPRLNVRGADWIIVVFDRDTIQRNLLPDLAQLYFGNPEGLEYKVSVVAGNPPKPIYSSDPDFGGTRSAEASMDIFGPAPQSIEGAIWNPTRGRSSFLGAEWRSFQGPLWFPVIQYGNQSGVWKLLVQHRHDSLDHVLAGIRRRNLFVSLSVLGILAASIAMLLLASHRAQTLSKLQMHFVANVSHELRTPLAVLGAATENIADGIVQDQQRLTQYCSIMLKQVRQVSDLVEQVLLFAATREIPSGPVLRGVPVVRNIEGVVDELRGFIEENGICLQQSVPDDLPEVWAEPSALSQCLRNLIVNAVKYRGETRWLGIEARVKIQDAGTKEVQITVQDRGLGIAESELKHIFKPFYRSPSVVAGNIHGTGLGLSLTKTLIEGMGGRITVDTRLGSGSAFTIHLEPAANRDVKSAGRGPETRS